MLHIVITDSRVLWTLLRLLKLTNQRHIVAGNQRSRINRAACVLSFQFSGDYEAYTRSIFTSGELYQSSKIRSGYGAIDEEFDAVVHHQVYLYALIVVAKQGDGISSTIATTLKSEPQLLRQLARR